MSQGRQTTISTIQPTYSPSVSSQTMLPQNQVRSGTPDCPDLRDEKKECGGYFKQQSKKLVV